jgi:hypothetical protein
MVINKIKNENFAQATKWCNMHPICTQKFALRINMSIIKPKSFSFLVYFEWSSWLWVHQVEVYNISLNSRGHWTMEKYMICSNHKNVWKKEVEPLSFKHHIFHFLYVLSDLKSYGCANKIYKSFLNAPKKTMFNILTFKSKLFWHTHRQTLTHCISRTWTSLFFVLF